MKTVFGAAMRHATKLTRAQNVIEATRVIQRALSGRGPDFSSDQRTPEGPLLIALPTRGAENADAFEPPREEVGIASPRFRDSTAEQPPTGRMRRPLGEVFGRRGSAWENAGIGGVGAHRQGSGYSRGSV